MAVFCPPFSSLCYRMSVFIEKAKKMGRPVSILQQLDRYLHSKRKDLICNSVFVRTPLCF